MKKIIPILLILICALFVSCSSEKKIEETDNNLYYYESDAINGELSFLFYQNKLYFSEYDSLNGGSNFEEVPSGYSISESKLLTYNNKEYQLSKAESFTTKEEGKNTNYIIDNTVHLPLAGMPPC